MPYGCKYGRYPIGQPTTSTCQVSKRNEPTITCQVSTQPLNKNLRLQVRPMSHRPLAQSLLPGHLTELTHHALADTLQPRTFGHGEWHSQDINPTITNPQRLRNRRSIKQRSPMGVWEFESLNECSNSGAQTAQRSVAQTPKRQRLQTAKPKQRNEVEPKLPNIPHSLNPEQTFVRLSRAVGWQRGILPSNRGARTLVQGDFLRPHPFPAPVAPQPEVGLLADIPLQGPGMPQGDVTVGRAGRLRLQ
jgi:hypothetical protein